MAPCMQEISTGSSNAGASHQPAWRGQRSTKAALGHRSRWPQGPQMIHSEQNICNAKDQRSTTDHCWWKKRAFLVARVAAKASLPLMITSMNTVLVLLGRSVRLTLDGGEAASTRVISISTQPLEKYITEWKANTCLQTY